MPIQRACQRTRLRKIPLAQPRSILRLAPNPEGFYYKTYASLLIKVARLIRESGDGENDSRLSFFSTHGAMLLFESLRPDSAELLSERPGEGPFSTISIDSREHGPACRELSHFRDGAIPETHAQGDESHKLTYLSQAIQLFSPAAPVARLLTFRIVRARVSMKRSAIEFRR
jgi:hypothetical protein